MSVVAPPPRARSAALVRALFGAALFTAAVSLSAALCLALPRGGGRAAALWIPNALLLTVLLRRPAREWPVFGALFLAAGAAAATVYRVPWPITAALWPVNLLEAVAACAVLRRRPRRTDDVTAGDMLGFFGVCAACAVGSGLIAATAIRLLEGHGFVAEFRVWTLAHALGLMVTAPCILTLARAPALLAEHRPSARTAAAFAGLIVAAGGVFLQSRAPVLFLVPPALLWVAIEAEVLGAAAGVLLVAAIAVAASFGGCGPLMLMREPVLRAQVMQLFIFVCLVSTLPVGLLVRRRRRLAAALQEAGDAEAIGRLAAEESEARYRLLADNASDVISRVRAHGAFEYVSPAVEAVLGWTPEELVGRRPREFVHPDDLGALRTALAARGAGGGPAEALEYRFRARDGRWVWLHSRPRIVRDEAGRPTVYVDVAHDVSGRRALEAELRAARAEAEAASAAKADFLANMTHELRTPLTAVLGFAALLADQPELSPESQRYLARIRSAGAALLGTVNDVLDLSKLEAGQVEIFAAPTAVGPLAREALDMLGAQAGAKEIALELRLLGSLPPRLLIDGPRLRHVLVNLIGNAVKFTEHGRVTVELEHARGRLRLAVRDTGPGISPEGMTLLFQRFSQVDGAFARGHGGTGLGLAICRSLSEAMGGAIRVDSEPGVGSVFTVELPAPEAAAGPAAPSGPTRACAAPRSAAGSVLVADDNPVNRELARVLLASLGYEVFDAADGREAVQLAGARPFDAVLLDLWMPGLDGTSAARAIRSGDGPNARCPLLAFSADPKAADLSLFDDVVAKPISPGALGAALAAVRAPAATQARNLRRTAFG